MAQNDILYNAINFHRYILISLSKLLAFTENPICGNERHLGFVIQWYWTTHKAVDMVFFASNTV